MTLDPSRRPVAGVALLACTFFLSTQFARGQEPPNPNPNAQQDAATVKKRGDVKKLPKELKKVLIDMAKRPHSALPIQAYGEADDKSLLFQYYLLTSTDFEPNVFTAKITGINDTAEPTATGPNGGIPTIGAVRLVVEPKEGLPVDPADPGAFIDVFTDISGLFVINNESGWYEGWMIHDVVVPAVAAAAGDGTSQYGAITQGDATALAAMGTGQNVPGNVFTTDGNAVHLPAPTDQFPTVQTNVVPVQVSMGAYNAFQQGDSHAYWEFNYNTNRVFPLYELPFTGGTPGTFEAGQIGALSSLIPGSGPSGVMNSPLTHGDNPNDPRDPDRVEADDEDQIEFRNRFIPSGVANEILLDVYVRVASFEPGVALPMRLFDAYAHEVAKVDADNDGAISFEESDIEGTSDGASNERLFLPATTFHRFAVTREIDDGLLAPRFAPSQRAWVLSGAVVAVDPPVEASAGNDGDGL